MNQRRKTAYGRWWNWYRPGSCGQIANRGRTAGVRESNYVARFYIHFINGDSRQVNFQVWGMPDPLLLQTVVANKQKLLGIQAREYDFVAALAPSKGVMLRYFGTRR